MKALTSKDDAVRGTTLIELLVYMLILSIVMGAIYAVLVSNFRAYDSVENNLVVQQDVRAALELMGRDIRMAGCDPAKTWDFGFQNDTDDTLDSDANSIHFTSDFDEDRQAVTPGEDVAYYREFVDDTWTLFRRADYGDGNGIVAEPVIDNVSLLQFDYLDANENPTGNFDDVRYVDVTLEAETGKVDALTKQLKRKRMTIRVGLRNAGMAN